jgi:uncharacterized metal-binding protein
MLLAEIVAGEVLYTEVANTGGLSEAARIKLLEDHQVAVLVCGGIDCELMAEIRAMGIEVISNVAGETDVVLAHLTRGDLRAGFGLSYHPNTHGPASRAAGEDADPDSLDCLSCPDKICLAGKSCPRKPGTPRPLASAVRFQEAIEVAQDVAAEPERNLCRIAELVYFTLGMRYEHLGLAFCTDLFSETEVVARLLRRYVRVTPVCCRLGTAVEEESQDGFGGPPCSPFAMAAALNEAKTDLNVLIGLCMGIDSTFAQLSKAPVTTLFVKDRMLAHNPVGAVHSRYVLERILGQR